MTGIDRAKAHASQDEAFTEGLKNIFGVLRANRSAGVSGAIQKFETAYNALLKDDADARAIIDNSTPE